MRHFAILLLLIMSSTGFSKTMINATIQREKLTPHIFTTPIDEFSGKIEPKCFPCKHYKIDVVATKVEADKSTEPPDAVLLNATLDLLNYDKFNDSYRFELSFKRGITILNHGDVNGPYTIIGNAKIFFAENNQESMIIEGRFNRKFGKGNDQFSRDNHNYPIIKESDTKPFELSVNNLDDLILSPRHDISVIIKTDI